MRKPVLELSKISVAFKDKKVLNELDFTAYAGEIIGVVAPNGTGKTTLFNVIANYLKPNSGEILFEGKYSYRSEKDAVSIYKKLVSFPDQSDLFNELSGVDHLKLYGNMWKGTTNHIQEIIDYLNMNSYVRKKVGTYSLGMRQRLCFAMMAAADTPIMLMDEVMNGLDITNVKLISERLIQMKKEHKLIFVASHLLENLDLYADRVIYFKNGQIKYQRLNDDQNEIYIKVALSKDQYHLLLKENSLPTNHLYIAEELLCIPLNGMPLHQQHQWIDKLLHFNDKQLTIGQLGTVENYKKYYFELL